MTLLYITNLGKICALDFLALHGWQEYDYRLEAAIQESGRRLGNSFLIRKCRKFFQCNSCKYLEQFFADAHPGPCNLFFFL